MHPAILRYSSRVVCHLDQLINLVNVILGYRIEFGLLKATKINKWATYVQSCRVQEGYEAKSKFFRYIAITGLRFYCAR